MKKLLVLTLTMAMLFTMTAIAEDSIIVSGVTTKDVTATYKEGTDGGTIYSVDIVWGSMAFTYNAESSGTWDPGTHTYNDKAEAEWTCDPGANVVKVTNHSNAELTANVSFSSTVDGVSGTFDKNELKLATAVGTDKDKAPNDSAYLTLSGELPKSEESVVVGNVTVELSSINNESNSEVIPEIFSLTSTDPKYFSSNGLTVNITGNNLSVLTKDNFDSYINIYSFDNTDTYKLPISGKNYVTFSNNGEKITIVYANNYQIANSPGELLNVKCKILKPIESDYINAEILINE